MKHLMMFFLLLSISAFGQVLRIESDPQGALVEIDGVNVGKTPVEIKVPGGYFHKTATAFGKRLGRPEIATIRLDGYVTRTFELTNGPWPWIDLNGNSHGNFYLLKMDRFSAKLEKVDSVFKTALTPAATLQQVSSPTAITFSIEDLIQKTSDAVLRIEIEGGHGSGFLVTRDGIAVTNRHVVGETNQVVAKTLQGQAFNGKVVYRDDELDLALIRLDVDKTPSIPFAGSRSIRVGQDVIAIGNPAQGMQNTVTRGIISGIGPEPDYGPGEYIQTDAAINPGNSGGPLLDKAGNVIGMNTLKAVRTASGNPLQSIGFAISAGSIVEALKKAFPNSTPVSGTEIATPQVPLQYAHLGIKSNISDGDIYIDGKFVGSMGSVVSLSSGDHVVEVRSDKYKTWQRNISVNGPDTVNVNATLEPQ